MNIVKSRKATGTPETNEDFHNAWFGSFIENINKSIKSDKADLESGEASKETRDFYTSLQNNDMEKAMSMARTNISQGIIKNLIHEYVNQIQAREITLNKLALDYSSNKVLVWAEVNDDDENSELSLIRVESIINGKFSETGITLDSIIIEKRDNLDIPPHYQPLQIT